MSEVQPILIPIPQAGSIIGKCRRGIYQLIATGELKAVKDGRSTRVVYEFAEAIRRQPAAGKIHAAARTESRAPGIAAEMRKV